MKVLMISRSTLFSVPGGDTVQISETAKALQKLGVEADIKLGEEKINYDDYDVIHFFNVIRPDAILPHLKLSQLPFVVSPVFVDYFEVERKFKSLPFRIVSKILGPDGIEYLKTIARAVKRQQKWPSVSYLVSGHKKSVETCLNKAVVLLPNSHSEYRRLKTRYSFDTSYIKVPNAVNNIFLEIQENQENRKGVICIGRIEVIKNQMNLIRAVSNTDIPLKIIGKAAPNHQQYYQGCKKIASENIQFLGQLSREEIIKELAGAKVHVLPSFFETTGLSSLEAAAMGCNVVITAKGDTEEYFGNMAYYCNPENPDSIANAIKEAHDQPVNLSLRKHISENYRWDIAALKTLEAYHRAVQMSKQPSE